jgi:hypothetical protein
LVGNRDGARGRTGDTVPGMKTLRAASDKFLSGISLARLGKTCAIMLFRKKMSTIGMFRQLKAEDS